MPRWVLEDEGRMIGSNHLPECLRDRMVQAAIVVVEDPFEIRLERLREEYFDHMWADFSAAFGEELGWKEYSDYLHHGLFAIRRRLGLQRFAEFTALLDAALLEQQRSGGTGAHVSWLAPLLNDYYDPMYRYQLERKRTRLSIAERSKRLPGGLHAEKSRVTATPYPACMLSLSGRGSELRSRNADGPGSYRPDRRCWR
jgi:hypothetical protein